MEKRQEEVVVPNSDQFDKQDLRAARGMVLLNTAAPKEETTDTIEIVSKVETKEKPKSEWPKFRGARK